jgi:hypothetical protein
MVYCFKIHLNHVVTFYTTRLNIKCSTLCLQRACVYCVDFRPNSEVHYIAPADWFKIQKNVFTVALQTKLLTVLLYRVATPLSLLYIQKHTSFVLSAWTFLFIFPFMCNMKTRVEKAYNIVKKDDNFFRKISTLVWHWVQIVTQLNVCLCSNAHLLF